MECYYCGKDCETQKIEVYSKHCDPPDERDVCEDCEGDRLECCVVCFNLQEQDYIFSTDWYQMIPHEYDGEDYEGYSGYDRDDVIHFFETHHHCDSCMKGLFEGMSWLEIYEQLNNEEER